MIDLQHLKRHVYWLPRRLRYSFIHPLEYRVCVYGYEIRFCLKDLYSLHWFLPRYRRRIHEPKATALLARLSQSGGDVLDIGSNLGWFTCISGVLSNARTHSFELDKENIQRLRTNVSLNNLHSVETNHAAVVDEPRAVTYWKEPETASATHSLGTAQKGEMECVEVKGINIDEYVAKYCENVALLKVDVEGGEKDVLSGSIQTINKHSPHIIVEVHPKKAFDFSSTTLREITYIIPKQYTIYRVDKYREDEKELVVKPVKRPIKEPNKNVMLYAQPNNSRLDDCPPPSNNLYYVI